jgi:hypothetical protein
MSIVRGSTTPPNCKRWRNFAKTHRKGMRNEDVFTGRDPGAERTFPGQEAPPSLCEKGHSSMTHNSIHCVLAGHRNKNWEENML